MKKNNNITESLRISLADKLAADLQKNAASVSYIDTLRSKLLAEGHIKTFEQKYVYTKEAKIAILEWYAEELHRQVENGSTDFWGHYNEVSFRIRYAIIHNLPFPVADAKCRSSRFDDAVIKIDNRVTKIEIKTNTGAFVYTKDKSNILPEFEKRLKENPLIIWHYDMNEPPLIYFMQDLMEALSNYNNKGLSTWLVVNDGSKRKDKMHSLKIQVYKKSEKKKAYLNSLAFESFDYDTILHYRML